MSREDVDGQVLSPVDMRCESAAKSLLRSPFPHNKPFIQPRRHQPYPEGRRTFQRGCLHTSALHKIKVIAGRKKDFAHLFDHCNASQTNNTPKLARRNPFSYSLAFP
jgi:hypothetical protein